MNEALQTINLASGIILNDNKRGFYSKYFDKFIKDNRITEKTTSNYITFLKHFSEYIKSNGIVNPQREDIREYQRYIDSYISKKTGKPLEETTKQQYFQVVKTFFQFLENEGLYQDITKGIKGFKIDKEERKRPFTEDEIRTILSSIDTSTQKGKRDISMILLSVENGLRIIEIQRANIEDLETIDNQRRLYIQGKGKKERNNFVNLSNELAQMIDEYLQTRPNARGNEPLFTSTSNRNHNKRIEETSISRLFKTIFKQSGFNSKKLTAHSLRHSSGTIYYEMTGDIYKVKNHQRHSEITSTTIYIHNFDRKNDDSGQMIHNKIFNSTQGNIKEDLLQTINSLDEEKLVKLESLLNDMKGSDIQS